MRSVNRFLQLTLMRPAATRKGVGERAGIFDCAFAGLHRVRRMFKRLKKLNRPAYYAVKDAIVAGLFYLLFRRCAEPAARVDGRLA